MEKQSFYDKYGIRYYGFALLTLTQNFILAYSQNVGLAMVLSSLMITIADKILKEDIKNFTKEQNKLFNQYPLFHLLPIYFYNIFSFYGLYWCLENYYSLFPTILDKIVATYFIGIRGSGMIYICHQLFHRDETYHKIIAYLNLITVLFPWYPLEHLLVHHKEVGTVNDPIVSPKNKSVYEYAYNIYLQAIKITYNASKPLFFLSLVLIAGWLHLIYKIFDVQRVIFSIGYAFFAFFQMQAGEYIEHYGLILRQSKDEKVTLNMSWNARSSIGNIVLFRFQRHSDHHINAYKIYSTMDLTDEMPQWPIDFLGAIVFTFYPTSFYDFANPLLEKALKNELTTEEQKKVALQKAQKTLNIYFLQTVAIAILLYII